LTIHQKDNIGQQYDHVAFPVDMLAAFAAYQMSKEQQLAVMCQYDW
jgi:hypothetical protein